MKNTNTIRRHAQKCALREHLVQTLANGTVIVPSVAATPQATIDAWVRHLNIGPKACVAVFSGSRCWVRYPDTRAVVAYG